MPEENRVFDVTKPKHVSPTPTSKPVIVGHHPMISDPMVKDSEPEDSIQKGYNIEPTKIEVNEDPPAKNNSHEDFIAVQKDNASTMEPADDNQSEEHRMSKKEHDMDAPGIMSDNDAKPDYDVFSETTPSAFDYHAQPTPEENMPAPAVHHHHPSEIQGLHLSQSKPKKKWPKLAGLAAVLLVAVYLAIDAGLIGGADRLPFHFFKHDEAKTATVQPTVNQPVKQPGPVVPSGFKAYKISGTDLTFAAPLAWGDPTSITESGYSKRGGANQADGTYAYVVNFAINKDIQIAVTSSKYLPPTRGVQYYDYLQWCTGTNDGKFYQSLLRFSTANKVDTPTTITCDQGPLGSATKLDDQTLLWAKATDAQNKVIGDIYIRNLKDDSLAVFRVKDAVMTNGDNIKQLLSTLQTKSATQ